MKNLFFFLFTCICLNINAQDYSKLIQEANTLYYKKQYNEGLQKMKEAIKIKSNYSNDLYNGACIASLAGDTKTAFNWLYKALKLGWVDVKHLEEDTDLNALHNSKKWKKLAVDMQKEKTKIEANYNKPLKAKLESILESDQGIRKEWSKAEKEFGMKITWMS